MVQKTLLEFRAGRMRVETNAQTKKSSLVADEQAGVIRLIFDDDGDMLRFEWRGGSQREEYILFDDDATFDKLKQAPPGARVYALRFASTGKRAMFYLLRRQDAAADDLLCERVRNIIRNPRAVLEAARSRNAAFELSGEDLMDEDIGDEAEPVDEDVDETPPSHAAVSTSAATPAGASSSSAASAAAMQSILSNLFATGSLSTREPLELNEVLATDLVGAHLSDAGIAPLLAELYELMPAGSGSAPADIVELLRSPQFQQAVSQLSQALSGGELASLMLQVGLPMPSDAQLASNEPIQVFLRAFIDKYKQQR
jgi:hypothetical protein